MRWTMLVLAAAACRPSPALEPPAPTPRLAFAPPTPAPALAPTTDTHEDLAVLLEQLDDEPRIGAIVGQIFETETGEPAIGVTIMVTSSELPMAQTAITQEEGTYEIEDLPPGDYLVTFYWADYSSEHRVFVEDEPVDMSLTIDGKWINLGCVGFAASTNTYEVDEIDTTDLTFD